MDKAQHNNNWTPEPWWDESGVAHAKGPEWTEECHSCVHPIANQNGTDYDVERACACVNGCTGFNPEAVPDMYHVVEFSLEIFRTMADPEHCMHDAMHRAKPEQWAEWRDAAQAALRKATE